MFTSVGVAASGGVAAALMIGASIFPTLFIQLRGSRLRGVGNTITDQEQVVETKG
jgi:hypothetical protein